jgi:hypothetical protein
MLRVLFMQQWFTLSDPGMEEAFFDTPLYREFAQLEEFGRLPDESTILHFRHRLETHQFAAQMLAVVNESSLKVNFSGTTKYESAVMSKPIVFSRFRVCEYLSLEQTGAYITTLLGVTSCELGCASRQKGQGHSNTLFFPLHNSIDWPLSQSFKRQFEILPTI